ncbi:ADP-ribosylglycohydrolase family protein [Desulfococcaceae bacterium HSG7]|nr:ADP-ribosylglycohydrolase family protein [Desulfococcaceae bacterium HSG7]
MPENISISDRFRGILLGTAVGDALGLPAEGMKRSRMLKRYPGRWRHRFVFDKGMLSDDTEHTLFVARSLLMHDDTAEKFIRSLAWRLRWWLLALPAGVGFATLRAILRLWVGFSPEYSGVFSAGNGPAMRSAIIGGFFADSPESIDAFTESSTRITHTDERALIGARAVAQLTGQIVRGDFKQRPSGKHFIAFLKNIGSTDKEWLALVLNIEKAIKENSDVLQFAQSIGAEKGVSGYIYQTVPVVLYAWYHHYNDFEATLTSVLNCGGDTDTTGAIAGALAGAVSGEKAIPDDWIDNIIDWPCSVNYIRETADRLAQKKAGPDKTELLRYFWPGVPLRNLLFLMIVLSHGLRRLLPPY